MEQRIEAFLHYLSAERGSSKNTIDAYRNDLTRFEEFAASEAAKAAPPSDATQPSTDAAQPSETPIANGHPGVDVLSRDLITAYILWLRNPQERAYAAATVARKVAAVKSFCAFLLDHGDITSNPTASIDSPHAPKRVPRPMSTADVDALLREPVKHGTPEAIRDAAMLELMYATGIRVTELVSLNVDSLHLDPPPAYVRCLGKGAKERSLPVYEQAVRAIERYLDESRAALVKDRPQGALFANRRGERHTRQGFWLILKGYAKSAGIEAHVTPHTLRHSFATHMLRGGASVRDVQELLGHANVSTTQVYTQLADSHLRAVYADAHPRAH